MSRDDANGHSTSGKPANGALVRRPSTAIDGVGAEDADAIRAEIARARTDVLSAMDDLQDRWGEVTSWRGLVARHPLTFALGAAGLGVLAALLFRPQASRRRAARHDND